MVDVTGLKRFCIINLVDQAYGVLGQTANDCNLYPLRQQTVLSPASLCLHYSLLSPTGSRQQRALGIAIPWCYWRLCDLPGWQLLHTRGFPQFPWFVVYTNGSGIKEPHQKSIVQIQFYSNVRSSRRSSEQANVF